MIRIRALAFAAGLALAASAQEPVQIGKALLAAQAEAPASPGLWALQDAEGKVVRVVRFTVEPREEGLSLALMERSPGATEGPYEVRTTVFLDREGRVTRFEQEAKTTDGTSTSRDLSLVDGGGSGGTLTTRRKGSKEATAGKFPSKADPRGLPAAVVPLVLARIAASLPAETAVEVISEDCQRQRTTPCAKRAEGGALVVTLDGKEVARVSGGKLERLHGLVAKEIDEAAARKLR